MTVRREEGTGSRSRQRKVRKVVRATRKLFSKTLNPALQHSAIGVSNAAQREKMLPSGRVHRSAETSHILHTCTKYDGEGGSHSGAALSSSGPEPPTGGGGGGRRSGTPRLGPTCACEDPGVQAGRQRGAEESAGVGHLRRPQRARHSAEELPRRPAGPGW